MHELKGIYLIVFMHYTRAGHEGLAPRPAETVAIFMRLSNDKSRCTHNLLKYNCK